MKTYHHPTTLALLLLASFLLLQPFAQISGFYVQAEIATSLEKLNKEKVTGEGDSPQEAKEKAQKKAKELKEKQEKSKENGGEGENLTSEEKELLKAAEEVGNADANTEIAPAQEAGTFASVDNNRSTESPNAQSGGSADNAGSSDTVAGDAATREGDLPDPFQKINDAVDNKIAQSQANAEADTFASGDDGRSGTGYDSGSSTLDSLDQSMDKAVADRQALNAEADTFASADNRPATSSIDDSYSNPYTGEPYEDSAAATAMDNAASTLTDEKAAEIFNQARGSLSQFFDGQACPLDNAIEAARNAGMSDAEIATRLASAYGSDPKTWGAQAGSNAQAGLSALGFEPVSYNQAMQGFANGTYNPESFASFNHWNEGYNHVMAYTDPQQMQDYVSKNSTRMDRNTFQAWVRPESLKPGGSAAYRAFQRQ